MVVFAPESKFGHHWYGKPLWLDHPRSKTRSTVNLDLMRRTRENWNLLLQVAVEWSSIYGRVQMERARFMSFKERAVACAKYIVVASTSFWDLLNLPSSMKLWNGVLSGDLKNKQSLYPKWCCTFRISSKILMSNVARTTIAHPYFHRNNRPDLPLSNVKSSERSSNGDHPGKIKKDESRKENFFCCMSKERDHHFWSALDCLVDGGAGEAAVASDFVMLHPKARDRNIACKAQQLNFVVCQWEW